MSDYWTARFAALPRCPPTARRLPLPMTLPRDPLMLLSFVNTKLRDEYPTLDELCQALGVERAEIEQTLAKAGFEYDEALRKFW